MAPPPQAGYSAVGYGKGAIGIAFQAWQEPGDDITHYKSLNGTLINIGCVAPGALCANGSNTPFYAYQPADAIGFSIVPGIGGNPGGPGLPVIYVGNPQRIGSAISPPNQTIPRNSSTPTHSWTIRPTPRSGTVWLGCGRRLLHLVTLNRSDLSLYSQNVYVTNCACSDHTNDNAQISSLATALSDTNPNRLFLLTSIGFPFNADSDDSPLTQNIQKFFGISSYALQGIVPDRLGTSAKAGFSMVGYPGSLNDVNKLYSTAGNQQQQETGALEGVFARKKNAYYETVNVAPFNQGNLPANATGDQYLRDSLAYAIGSSEPVAWPFMDTSGEKNAYAYLSTLLINANLYPGNQCTAVCADVRYYYTGIDAATVYSRLQPNAVAYPGDTPRHPRTASSRPTSITWMASFNSKRYTSAKWWISRITSPL